MGAAAVVSGGRAGAAGRSAGAALRPGYRAAGTVGGMNEGIAWAGVRLRPVIRCRSGSVTRCHRATYITGAGEGIHHGEGSRMLQGLTFSRARWVSARCAACLLARRWGARRVKVVFGRGSSRRLPPSWRSTRCVVVVSQFEIWPGWSGCGRARPDARRAPVGKRFGRCRSPMRDKPNTGKYRRRGAGGPTMP